MVVRFGGFEVDLDSGELRRGGVIRTRLQDQALRMLTLLVQRPGQLVGRDALRQRLWPGEVHTNHDHGLAKTVLKLRTALGDSAESPRFIETIPRRGYRFLADVECPDATALARGEASPAPRRPGRSRGVVLAAALIVVGAVLGALIIRRPVSPRGRSATSTSIGGLAWRATNAGPASAIPVAPVLRLTLKLDGGSAGDLRLSVQRSFVPFALSPDGTRLVFHARVRGGDELFLRELSGAEARPLPGTEGAFTPFFSPDGRWVGFWRAKDRTLRKVSVSGGSSIEIGVSEAPERAIWGADGEILLDGNPGLWSMRAEGGPPQEVLVSDRSEGERIWLRSRIPGRRDLLIASDGPDGVWLEVLSRETGGRRRLLRGGGMAVARFTPTGHVVYGDDDTLFAVPMDMERLEPVGVPVPLLQGIDRVSSHSNVALCDSGTAVYLPAEGVRKAEMVWVDRTGKTTPVPQADSFEPLGFSLSPGGHEAAVVLVDGSSPGVWVVDLERGSKRLLAPGGRSPIFSRDGAFITYQSSRGTERTFTRRRSDGTGDEERLLTPSSPSAAPLDWSPDGRSLLYAVWSSRGDRDVWVRSGDEPSPLLASPLNEWSARFSPDGRLVAYDVEEGGETNVYVQPFPGPGPRTPVSIRGGVSPRWGRDGRELYYDGQRGMMVVDVETEPVLRVGPPKQVFEGHVPWHGYDVTADGRFLVRRPRETAEGPVELKVILNWFAELERLAPHPAR